jgi:hypothetical protein
MRQLGGGCCFIGSWTTFDDCSDQDRVRIATVSDVSGIIIYFSIAKVFLL